jgi:hypothetical protein
MRKQTARPKAPKPADNPPPPAGSLEELAETALGIGWPGAFSVTCKTVEQVIRHRLLWKSE